jgi:flagellar assembly protein FliH
MEAASVAPAETAESFSFDQLPPDPTGGVRVSLSADAARSQAAAIIDEAREEADRMRAEARRLGHEEGYAAGMAAAREELRPGAEALATAVTQAAALRVEAAETVEGEAAELALQIAEKVVAGALAVQPERIVDVVRGALRCLVERERVTIQVNTMDLELVRDSIAELTGTLGGIEHVEVQEERRVSRGGAIVRSATGEIDATIEGKLARARDVIESELGA